MKSATEKLMEKEVIALLPTDDEQEGPQQPQALVRLADGRMALEDIKPESSTFARTLARFRRSRPILDPDTREVIGYEMVQISMPAPA
jgi:hypothetical protein